MQFFFFFVIVSIGAKGVRIAPEFEIKQNRFLQDGQPVQLISGSVHYFRIHPAYWRDRLLRGASLGLNAIEVYVPWNFHEPFPGRYYWEGFANLDDFIGAAQELGLLVILRPGPYICAEWDFGGLPWWLASSQVAGGGSMRLRTSDPTYLAYVDRWWGVLLPRLRPLLYQNGGPVVMVQIENEYGFCGSDKAYLRHLRRTARRHLGNQVLLFTTDPPGQADAGSLPGEEVYTAVDFGPGWFNPDWAFATQARLNARGLSPPFCSEFYTGWLTHWGERMANTSTGGLVEATRKLLQYANGTASLNFYMVHGGTNFGFWGGANVDGQQYQPHITSYDYDAPISESGDFCQPGIGGGCKFMALREAIARHTGRTPPPVPAPPRIQAYGTVLLHQSARLLESLEALHGRDGAPTDTPQTMEEHGQRWGLILYRTRLPPDSLTHSTVLDLGSPVHDYAQVFADGQLLATVDRSSGRRSVALPPYTGGEHGVRGETGVVLDLLVHAMGRRNFGCEEGGWDRKGLTSPVLKLNGTVLRSWEVFPLQLDSLDAVPFSEGGAVVEGAPGKGSFSVASFRRWLGQHAATLREEGGEGMSQWWGAGGAAGGQQQGRLWSPTFYRGVMRVAEAEGGGVLGGSHPPDTYLSLAGWGKGLAWVNGFNLGWYWPSRGPQMTLYVPGPVLRWGGNQVVLLELEGWPAGRTVRSVQQPDFGGP